MSGSHRESFNYICLLQQINNTLNSSCTTNSSHTQLTLFMIETPQGSAQTVYDTSSIPVFIATFQSEHLYFIFLSGLCCLSFFTVMPSFSLSPYLYLFSSFFVHFCLIRVFYNFSLLCMFRNWLYACSFGLLWLDTEFSFSQLIWKFLD